MDESERRAAGLKIRRKVLGDAHVDRAIARTTALTGDFQDLLTRYAWGEIWARPGLDVRSRRVLVLGTLVALGRWEEFAHARPRRARRGRVLRGGPAGDRAAAGDYCGVPAANKAFEVLTEIAEAK